MYELVVGMYLQLIHTSEREEYIPQYAFCNAISTSTKTKLIYERRYP